MWVTETTRKTPTRRADPRPFVFFRGIDRGVVETRERSLADSYEIQVAAPEAIATSSVVNIIPGAISFPIPRDNPIWRAWLPEIGRFVDAGLRVRSAVAEQVEEVQRVTGLSDGQLAAAFPGGLTRETINRWRNRPNPNLREENAYRLGLLYELAQRMQAAGMEARSWLHQAGEEGETPYALICQGRLADVRRAVDAIAAGALSAIAPMAAVPAYREHDVVVGEEGDGEWVAWDPDEDAEE